VHHDVGDVAVDEQLARQQAGDFVGGHSAVGAADPEIVRRLLPQQLGEESGVGLAALLRPFDVLVEEP
jgi:hypothetical protein